MIKPIEQNTGRGRVLLSLATALLLAACSNDGGGGVNVSAAFNDTGITGCTDGVSVGLACPQTGYPGQDAEYGRDSTYNDDSNGHAGFSFTKRDSTGAALADQSATYGVTPWDCVEDRITGLMWEVKATDAGLRDSTWTYTWYNSTGTNDGGSVGTANGGTCVDLVNCDTEKYVAAVNAAGLCGYSDWRLPSAAELLSISDLSVAAPGPAIDSNYFPNSMSNYYFTSTPAAGTSSIAWGITLDDGSATYFVSKSTPSYVRLVR